MGWREESVATALFTVVFSIWLIASPEAPGYAPDDAARNPVVCGIIALLSLVGLKRGRELNPE